MNYKNGRDILPDNLLSQLQEYIQGQLIYIPKKKVRAGWGQVNGTRELIDMRNSEIFGLYKRGASLRELVKKYNLSEDSIRKIVLKHQKLSKASV